MKKLFFLSLFSLLAVLAVGFVLIRAKTPVQAPAASGPVFYYGDGCPHCANVEEFLKSNPLPADFNMARKEVYNNKQNSQELVNRAKECGLATDSVGIPFLYNQGKCLIGDIDIIAYFKTLK